MEGFLPICKEDMKKRGWNELDFVFVTGDAYVDHPSFGCAILTRLLESKGYKVGVLSQPQNDYDFNKLPKPRLAFLVSSGNVDSMVAHYTVAKKLRKEDSYSPGKKMGLRPDRAVNVYCKTIRRLFGDTPIVIGGIEASLRRFSHYDYWEDEVKPSILLDSGADILSYGMGERQTLEIAYRLKKGQDVKTITDVRGTCFLVNPKDTPIGCKECPSFEQVKSLPRAYAKACKIQNEEQDEVVGKTIIQRQGKMMLVQNPPMQALSQEEFDEVYKLPYMRTWHPCYDKFGGIAAIEEVEFSITHNRGCFGDCNFCAISLHQGRRITTRSEGSVLEEAKLLTSLPNFKGYIHDVGGPTANFRHPSCKKQITQGLCKGKKCLAPTACKNLDTDHSEYVRLLRKIRKLPKIKKVFIRSGIRYDYVMADKNGEFISELVNHHVSGQLKVAPEHCVDAVLDFMGKPHGSVYKKFMDRFYESTKKAGKEQYLVPYLMSSHPGCDLKQAVELAEFLKKNKIRPEQVQDFYPTPGTISTCMFYTGINPLDMEPVYVPKRAEEKAMQRALLQYFVPRNKELVLKALKICRRTDLIGSGKNCLVKEDQNKSTINNKSKRKGSNNKWRGNAKTRRKR